MGWGLGSWGANLKGDKNGMKPYELWPQKRERDELVLSPGGAYFLLLTKIHVFFFFLNVRVVYRGKGDYEIEIMAKGFLNFLLEKYKLQFLLC